MPLTDSPSFLSMLSIRRNQVQVASLEPEHDSEELDLFQRHVADRFSELVSPAGKNSDHILSIAWLSNLLDLFLRCEAEFKSLILVSAAVKPPLDLLDRTVKALDVCNAVTHGVDSVRQCQKLAEIAVAALEQRPLGDGRVKRAKKALTSLLASLTVDDREGSQIPPERAWSFGRRGGGAAAVKGRNYASWSAAKQIQAMSSNLAPPRWAETTTGLSQAVYTMNSILVFAMWALVAAIPCPDRSGLPTNCPIPKQFGWAQSLISIHDKIGDEWKRKEKKGSSGLMVEMRKLEKLGTSLMEFAEGFQFPATEERLEEVAAQVAELSETCRTMEEGLRPLQQQIREVFHSIVRSRNEIVDAVNRVSKSSITIS